MASSESWLRTLLLQFLRKLLKPFGVVKDPITISRNSSGMPPTLNWDVTVSAEIEWTPSAEEHEVMASSGSPGWPRAEVYKSTAAPPADLIKILTLTRTDGGGPTTSPGTYGITSAPVGTVKPEHIKVIAKFVTKATRGKDFT